MAVESPDWPAPKSIHTRFTTRTGGVSSAPYASLNLSDHVGDTPAAVAHNRHVLQQQLAQTKPCWLEQVHGTQVIELHASSQSGLKADGSFCKIPGIACVVMTADCLPILLCRMDGSAVSALHAGWRGLCDGIIEQGVSRLGRGAELMAWLGPCIGPNRFEIGIEVVNAFCVHHPNAKQAFYPSGERWYGDLQQLAIQRLNRLGVTTIYRDRRCTYNQADEFFSYRRDGETGRMASLIWID